MFLYHYNTLAFKTLKTLALQQTLSEAEKRDNERAARFRGDYPYHDNISLFFEPAPLDLLDTVFPKNHHLWVKGRAVVEHRIAVDQLSLYAWIAVETPISSFLIDTLPWSENEHYKRGFFQLKKAASIIARERGTTLHQLKRFLARFKPGTTRQAYQRLKDYKHYDEVKHLYAPTVPHLMLYTKDEIPVHSTHTRVVGHPLTTHTLESLHSLQWSALRTAMER